MGYFKDKKGTNAFEKILDKSNRKPNRIWIDKGSEYCNISMKSWLEKIMKNEVFTFTDKLDDIINKYNNTYHNTTKMKPVNVKSNKCINS